MVSAKRSTFFWPAKYVSNLEAMATLLTLCKWRVNGTCNEHWTTGLEERGLWGWLLLA